MLIAFIFSEKVNSCKFSRRKVGGAYAGSVGWNDGGGLVDAKRRGRSRPMYSRCSKHVTNPKNAQAISKCKFFLPLCHKKMPFMIDHPFMIGFLDLALLVTGMFGKEVQVIKTIAL